MQAFTLEAFRDLSSHWIWPALLHSVWIGLFTASLAAFFVQAAVKISHRARHAILLAGLALVLVGPVFAAALQYTIIAFLPVEHTASSGIVTVTRFGDRGSIGGGGGHSRAQVAREDRARSRSSFNLRGAAAFFPTIANRIRSVVVAAWVLGVMIIAGCFLFGASSVRRFSREAQPAAENIQRTARGMARRLRLARVPQILAHSRVEEPFLAGVRHPVILLPGRAIAGMSRDCLDAILAHELAHACRRDHIVNLAQRVVEMLLFFHPGVHWLSRCLRRQREFCADALAIRLTHDPVALAGALESIALLRRTGRPAPATASTFGGHSSSLLPRIQELLGMKPSRKRFVLWPLVAVPASGFFALVAVSAGLAQERSGPAIARAGDTGRPLPAPDDEKPQIVYEVRFLAGHPSDLRGFLLEQRELPGQDENCKAWIIDAKTLADWLKRAGVDRSLSSHTGAKGKTKVIQVPKITAFAESSPAAFAARNEAQNSLMVRKSEGDRMVPGQAPVSKTSDFKTKGHREDAKESSRATIKVTTSSRDFPAIMLQAKGAVLPGKIRVSVDVGDSFVHGRSERIQNEVANVDGGVRSVSAPIYNRKSHVGCEIPTGSYLAICMGLHPEPVTPYTRNGPVAGVAPGGAPQPTAEADASERLVVFILGAREATNEAGAKRRVDQNAGSRPQPAGVVEPEFEKQEPSKKGFRTPTGSIERRGFTGS